MTSVGSGVVRSEIARSHYRRVIIGDEIADGTSRRVSPLLQRR